MKKEITDLQKKIDFQKAKIEEIPEVAKRRKTIAKLQLQVNALINGCKHTNSFAKYDGNTGNYDPSADCYWVRAYCCDCDRLFRFGDDEEGYRSSNWGRTLSKWNEEDKKLIKKYCL